jgi:predicted ATP-grasp superfamily ATP-dependent carboligase
MRLFVYEYLCSLDATVHRSCSSLADEGWAMLAAVLADFAQLPGMQIATLLGGSASDWAGRLAEQPELAAVVPHYCREAERLARFDELARAAEAVLVIAPEFDHILLDLCRRVMGLERTWLGCEPAAIELVMDKARLNESWLARGVPTPRLRSVHSTAYSTVYSTGPFVAKPRIGAGSQATFLLPRAPLAHELQSLAIGAGWSGELIVQEFVRGTAASVSLLLGPAQTIALMPGQQLLATNGRFTYLGGQVPLASPLRERAKRLALAAIGGLAGLRGYVGVDMVLGEAENGSQDYAIEINPRLTTSYVGLRRLAQTNLAECWLRLCLGEPVAEPLWHAGAIRFKPNGAWTAVDL